MFAILAFGIILFYSDWLYKTLNLGGLKYQTLVIDKNAFNALPNEIKSKDNFLDKNISFNNDSNITYITKNGDKFITIHNIKAISTIGKFYYLESNDGVKFELNSEFIKSRNLVK
ncbi:Uncharacterised protein [Campylobacter geochelonis]|uniref:Uncharacterized protein n=1 Tax=Campylobacter geochelonis TaxID=1780362 RepID=A0A128EIX5_9BACT|nr:Uncharacterised protein [Campylobacter geochelonis]